MCDPQCEKDRRDAAEAKEEALQHIQDMNDQAFLTWWNQSQADESELATRRFAAATMYHEEPAW